MLTQYCSSPSWSRQLEAEVLPSNFTSGQSTSDKMATPLDQIKCLPSQTGDAAQDTEVPKISITPTDRKNAVLKKLRAPPLTHGWEFWHDR